MKFRIGAFFKYNDTHVCDFIGRITGCVTNSYDDRYTMYEYVVLRGTDVGSPLVAKCALQNNATKLSEEEAFARMI